MNKLDEQYIDLLKDILENGVEKETRNGKVLSVFGRTIRHKMSDGFPILTTKKVDFKNIVTELVWFLQGRTDLKYLVDNNCNIWVGDAYQKYLRTYKLSSNPIAYKDSIPSNGPLDKQEFIRLIKTDNWFSTVYGDLGPIYGAQWRKWDGYHKSFDDQTRYIKNTNSTDQFQELIDGLKMNPDDRGLIVSAWNVDELEKMTLRPCHNFFQCYTRELTLQERILYLRDKISINHEELPGINDSLIKILNERNVPTRAISLMWNQRSVDTCLGLPYNIASYGLLLEIIAEITNMVPDELIGTLGDTHIYLNHIEGAKEQIGKELNTSERYAIARSQGLCPKYSFDIIDGNPEPCKITESEHYDRYNVPKFSRQPFALPKLYINSEFWAPGTDDGCTGMPGSYTPSMEWLIKSFELDDFSLENYKHHPHIKFPLSN